MKVSKWVDMGQDVEVEIGADDIRYALSEAFSRVIQDPLGEAGPTRKDVTRALNDIATFLNALTDPQIDLLNLGQRSAVHAHLLKTAERFKIPGGME